MNQFSGDEGRSAQPPSTSAVEFYRHLTIGGPQAVADLDEAAHHLVAELVAHDLAASDGTRIEAVSPVESIHALIREGAEALARARTAGEELERAWAHRPGTGSGIEVVTGLASDAAFDRLIHGAEHIWALHNKRWVGAPDAEVPEAAFEVLARGTTIQVVYDTQMVTVPTVLQAVRTCVAAGEQARVLPDVPLSMTLSETTGVISLPGPYDFAPDRLVVHSPPLLGALRKVFESLWSKAAPVSATGEDTRREDDRAMLTLLALGLTDQAIGRELGISERTVRRRITTLQSLLGARTRFQLGAQASRQGWLDS